MGNCLAAEAKVVKIMTMDGKILEYKSPMMVNRVLLEFKDHGVSDTLPVSNYMNTNAELVSGCVYYLVPLQNKSAEPRKKTVRFCVPEVEGEASSGLRIKLVISKQKLKEIIEGGVVSIDRMVSEMQKEEAENTTNLDAECNRKKVWKPALNSIIEAD